MKRVGLLLILAVAACAPTAARPATQDDYLLSTARSWSVDGSRLYFWSNLPVALRGGESGLFVVNADGTGLERVLPERADGEYLRTPDGRRVAFLKNDGVLYSIDENGIEQHVIAREITRDGSVSPDGSLYAFAKAVSLKLAHTRIVDLSNGTVRGVGVGFNPTFSPDGTKLAVEDDDVVLAYDLDSGKVIFDSYDCCYNPEPIVFSPDGTRAAFTGASKERGDDTGDVYVADLRTGTYRRIAPGGTIDSWSPDSTRIAFAGGYSIRADGTDPRRIFRPVPGFGFRLSPDWTRYAFSTYGALNGYDLYIGTIGRGRPVRVSPSQCAVLTDRCLSGGSTDDRLRGGPGREVILGGFGNDRLDGGGGHDLVDGELWADTLSGGPGRDALFGGYGNDVLRGGPGGDALRGGVGADQLLGGGGRDTLFGNPGSDVISGGAGADVIYADRYDDHDRITCGAGIDEVKADRTDRVAADCERVTRRRNP